MAMFAQPSVESLKEFQKRAYFKGRELPDYVWRAAVERMKSSNARQVIEAQTPEDFLDERLPSLRKPVFLLWGKADRISPIATGQRFKALLRNPIWQDAPDCGHLPQKECPLEVIRAIGSMVTYGAV
jgi:pimeloyl-ACP methyl ester carboxylesterase